MSDQLEQLKALLLQAQAQQPAAPATNGWAQPAPPAAAAGLPITGISIPVKVDTPLGSVRVDLHLPAECGQSPQALLGAIQLLVQAGYPVDAWKPRDSGGGWGGASGGSGWGNNTGNGGGGFGGGGYGRGGYGRRW